MIEPARFDRRHAVPCGRLDELVALRPVKLLKVDAEGAEPEVLLGARRLLPYCQHVVIDAGPERGVDQVPTAAEVINTVVGFGFDVVQVDQSRLVIAFGKRQSAEALAGEAGWCAAGPRADARARRAARTAQEALDNLRRKT